MAAVADEKTVNKVALCSAIFAGFAYVGYSVVRNAICRRGGRGGAHRHVGTQGADDDDVPCTFHTIRRLSVASQTDFLLGNLDVSNGGIVRPLSVQERIRELNLQARHFGGEEGIIMRFSPFYKPRSLQCSPWSSPRILSPVDIDQFMSRSAENLNHSYAGGVNFLGACCTSPPPASPLMRRKSTCKRRTRSGGQQQQPHQQQQLQPKPYHQSNCSLNGDEVHTHQVTEVHILLKDSEETLRKRLDGLYNRGRVITPYEAQSLVALLYTQDEQLLVRTLTTITNCSAFSVNQDYFREAGCLCLLTTLLSTSTTSEQAKLGAIQAVGNLSLNHDNVQELKSCLAPLMSIVESGESDLLLPVLITLTNLAVLPDWHSKYVRILHQLSELLSHGSDAVQLQVCKLMVNLSCNPNMVPHLLAAQAPSSLIDLLGAGREEEFLMRLTTVLDNLTSTVEEHSLDGSQLPAEEKAPSPETLYAAIYGLNVTDKLRNRVFVLTKHANEEVRAHSKRIYDCLKG